MEKSESIANLAKSLCEFQRLMGKIKKDSNNPFFKSKYASLSTILTAIQEPLHQSDLSFVQFPAGQHGLTTILLHKSGEFISESYVMTPVKNDPQGLGSSITYQRRYALGAILGLNIDDDDDANAASTQPVRKTEPAKPQAIKPAKASIPDGLLDNIEGSVSREELLHIWEENKPLQTVPEFVAAITRAKDKLPEVIHPMQNPHAVPVELKTKILLLLGDEHSVFTADEKEKTIAAIKRRDSEQEPGKARLWAETLITKLQGQIKERSTNKAA